MSDVNMENASGLASQLPHGRYDVVGLRHVHNVRIKVGQCFVTSEGLKLIVSARLMQRISMSSPRPWAMGLRPISIESATLSAEVFLKNPGVVSKPGGNFEISAIYGVVNNVVIAGEETAVTEEQKAPIPEVTPEATTEETVEKVLSDTEAPIEEDTEETLDTPKEDLRNKLKAMKTSGIKQYAKESLDISTKLYGTKTKIINKILSIVETQNG